MEKEFGLLEKKIITFLEKYKSLEADLKKCQKENQRLRKENSELSAMLESQSVRVDALLSKLEEALKNQNDGRGVHDEKNGDF